MAHKGLTEEEAYRFLRKLAMDQNKRLAEIAESILSLAQLSKAVRQSVQALEKPRFRMNSAKIGLPIF